MLLAKSQLNGEYACDSRYLLNDVLKKAWAYQGWVMTDWGAAHSTVKATLAGLDQEMPTGTYFGDTLKAAVLKGEVPMTRLDDMVRRILRTEIALGIVDKFDAIVGAEDYVHGKPSPDPFLEAAKRLGARPDRCVVWEDSDLGIAAAKAGGMAWIDVRSFHSPRRMTV